MAQPRYTYRRSFFSNYFTTGVKWLLIVNTAVFILTQLLSPQLTGPIRLLALSPVAVVRSFALWQLATYLFLHGGVWHLVSTCSRCGCSVRRWSATGARGGF